MALFDPNNPNFNQTPVFDYQANKDNLDLRKKLAAGAYNSPISSGQMVGGWYAPVSAGSQFAQALGKVAGGLAIGKLNQDNSGLAQQDASAVDAATGYTNPLNQPQPQQLGNSYSSMQPDGANWMSTGTQPQQYSANTQGTNGVFGGAAQQPNNGGGWLSTGDMTGASPTDYAQALKMYAMNGQGGSGNSSGQQDSNASPVDSSDTGSVTPQLNLSPQLSKEDQAKQDDAKFWHDVTRLAYSGPAGRMLADNMVSRKNAIEQAQLNYVYKAPNYEAIKNSDGDVTGFFDKTSGKVFGINGQQVGASGGLGGTQPTLRDLQKQREQQQLEGKTPEQQLAAQKAAQERATKVGEINSSVAGIDNSMRDTNRLITLIRKYGTGGLNNVGNAISSAGGLVGIEPQKRAELQEMQTLLNQGTFHTAIGLLNGAGRLGQAEFKAINDHSMTPSTDLSTAANLNILQRQLDFLKAKKEAASKELQGYTAGDPSIGVNGLDAAAPEAQAPAQASSNGKPAGYRQRYTAPAGGVPNI